MNKENKLIHKIQDKTEKFYDSWISILILSGSVSLIAIVQIFIFVFTDKTISGFAFGDKGSWIVWIYLFSAFPFGISAMTSYVFSIRGDSRFFIWGIATEAGYLISGLTGGMMWSVWMVLFMFIVNLIRYNLIKKDGADYKINENRIYLILAVIVSILFILGILSVALDNNNIYWWNEAVYDKHRIVQYMDVIAACLTVSGGFLILAQNKHVFTLYILCDILYLFLFANAHQWSNVVLTSIYIISSTLALISWSDEYKELE